MKKTNYSIKDYKNDIKRIYQIKDDDDFKSELTKLYSRNDINPSWKITSLRKLLRGEKKFVEIIVLIVSGLLSALTTTVINYNGIKQVRTQSIDIVLRSFNLVLPFLIILGLVLGLFTLAFVAPFLMATISSQDIERRNFEIEQIINTTGKKSLSSVFEKENKKVLLKKLVIDTLLGILVAVGATVLIVYIV